MSTINPSGALPPATPVIQNAAATAPPAAGSTSSEPFQEPLVDKFGDGATNFPCVGLRVLLNEGIIHPDSKGNESIADLDQGLKKLGPGWFTRQAALTAVKMVLGPISGATGLVSKLTLDHINLWDLKNGPLMHNADTGILRNGFDQAAFDKLMSYSSDGNNITVSDLAAAQKKRLETDPGSTGHTNGAAEMTLLIGVFGEKNADGDRFLSKQDLTTLYKDARFPEGWKERKWNAATLGIAIYDFMKHQKNDAPRADDGSPLKPADTAAAAGADKAAAPKGVCPFLSGLSFDPAEAAKQHSDMVPG